MASLIINSVLFVCLLLVNLNSSTVFCSSNGTSDGDRKVYIVYMGERPKGEEYSASMLHTSMLQEIVGSSGASDYLVHSYHRSFNGFAAKLTQEEKQKISGMEGVVSVFLSRKLKLQTTRSWNFMNFPVNSTRSTKESNIIVGMLDTGVWPESQSFSDEGYGPPPSKWKGTCQGNSNFTCNNKIIGARYYHIDGKIGREEFASPRDAVGHGTHTASIVAGNLVHQASLFGFATGTARGGVPSARIAVYKICWRKYGCEYADILAAFDDAIADGVDIISLSVGADWSSDYFADPIAIGAFHAMKNRILTSNAAGNGGPEPGTVRNYSPWSLSVGASTIDRTFMTGLKLGNGAIYQGVSINPFSPEKDMYPITYGGGCIGSNSSSFEGKIVLSDDWLECEEILVANGASGMVSNIEIDGNNTDSFALPATMISPVNITDVMNYLNSTSEPTATIFKTVETIKDEFAPSVPNFSSRGPNPITKDILKPDLIAPGKDILAAWSEATSVTGTKGDKRVLVPYNIDTGTSMSCPHASAAAAYVKSFHPTWSPAAIKSALMTTAYPMSSSKNTDAEFAYGSGHINPSKATDPGLVYDAEELDYVKFLCGQGYNSTQLQLVIGDNSACSEQVNGTVWDLNYPSFALSAGHEKSVTRTFRRTVTNVGGAKSSYKAVINSPEGLKIQVKPDVLSFKSVREKQSFAVTVEASMIKPMISGSLVWDDGKHQVRSPIVGYLS